MIKLFSIKWFKLLPAKINSLFNLFIFFFTESKKIKKAEILFFFPFYHIGGAEKVHIDIVNCFKNNNTYIFFQGKSSSDSNKKKFIQNSHYYEVFELLNRSRFTKKIFLESLSKMINNSIHVNTLFSSNSSFFYTLIPNINSNIKKIDLIHAFSYPDSGLEIFSIPYVSYLTERIVINNRTYSDFKKLYHKNNLDIYLDRIKIIQNGISLKKIEMPIKEYEKIKICYVGRWSKEKRPELFLKIARRILQENSNFEFYFVGTDDVIHREKINDNGVINIGEVKNTKDLEELYKKFHFILITSYREGFPIVLMEAMSFGVVPICTNIGGISEHIVDSDNGFLIDNNQKEEEIISNFIRVIQSIIITLDYPILSKNVYNYAQENFSIQKFQSSYKERLLGPGLKIN